MLFNSYSYILCFLPLVVFGYYLLRHFSLVAWAKAWLVFASLFFYGFWNPAYVPLLLASKIINYVLGRLLLGKKDDVFAKKALLACGLLCNIGLLAYFKYTDFFIGNLNGLLHADFSLLHIVLPLGISFFTFQQIAYIIDCYQGKVEGQNILDYCLFVSFFPQLISGPIVHHAEMIRQFKNLDKKDLDWNNVSAGLSLFFMGLFKKVAIADTFAVWANAGFGSGHDLGLLDSWATSLSFTFQLYFDFSGYTDMALGTALLFNIALPANFNSPYKALSIGDFWRRWHMTLNRFLSSYVYIPLGGNRRGDFRSYRNVLITFLIGGIWHGAGWTFVAWGLLHGTGLIVNRLWRKTGKIMPAALAWFITFNVVNIGWVFFRAHTFAGAIRIIKGMIGMHGIVLPAEMAKWCGFLQNAGLTFGPVFWDVKGGKMLPLLIVAFLGIVLWAPNSNELARGFKPSRPRLAFLILMASYALINVYRVKEFLYFNF
ncbi:MAG: MBOAT family protein [Chitinivibrionales bacterium]|nr:MBOAT family protein [Chitinivibrionales bacterium]